MPDHFEEEVLTEQGWVALQRGWRKPKKSKKTEKQSRDKCCTQRFPAGDCFFSRFFPKFLVLDSEAFIGYRAEKKIKKLEGNQKTQKSQSLGRDVVPKDFLQGIVFLFLFCFVCFFSRSFLIFGS